jgi:hypothetical protein
MLDHLTLTNVLALFIGVYMVAAGVGMLVDRKRFAGVIDAFYDSTALSFMAGIVAFSLGAVIVALHDIWSTPVAIAVSAIGWIAVIEGVLLMAFRAAFLGVVRVIPFNAATIIPFSLVALVFGAWLIVSAFS